MPKTQGKQSRCKGDDGYLADTAQFAKWKELGKISSGYTEDCREILPNL